MEIANGNPAMAAGVDGDSSNRRARKHRKPRAKGEDGGKREGGRAEDAACLQFEDFGRFEGKERRKGEGGALRYRSFHLAAAAPGLPEEAAAQSRVT